MNLATYLRRLSCHQCDWTQVWGPEEMAQQLRRSGKLRRATDAEPAIILALFEPLAVRLSCPGCEALGVQLQLLETAMEGDWGQARLCEVCRQPIPTERLEIFPKSTRCAACQDRPCGQASDDDFCPRCGDRMRVCMGSGAARITRYQLKCRSCGFHS